VARECVVHISFDNGVLAGVKIDGVQYLYVGQFEDALPNIYGAIEAENSRFANTTQRIRDAAIKKRSA